MFPEVKIIAILNVQPQSSRSSSGAEDRPHTPISGFNFFLNFLSKTSL